MDKEWLAILRCPVTREKLREEGEWLVSEGTGVKYPIRDGVPVLLLDEAVVPNGVGSVEELMAKTNGKT